MGGWANFIRVIIAYFSFFENTIIFNQACQLWRQKISRIEIKIFAGYRDDSIREVHKNEADLGLPLTVVSYQELYGWTMDEIVARIGRKNNCTFCGVFWEIQDYDLWNLSLVNGKDNTFFHLYVLLFLGTFWV